MKPVLKILTDYPRDDLAHDEVQQALVTACLKFGIDAANIDVGAIPGMDTVTAGFKTAQLALNSKIGFGHVIHTNCAPRKNMTGVQKSQGEKIVLGITHTGVVMLIVNAGYALSLFRNSVMAGEMALFQTFVPDSGSQFRSRDYFPDALAELAAHVTAQQQKMGADKIAQQLVERKYAALLQGLSYVGAEMDATSIPVLSTGAVLYTDSFGNIKLHLHHADLLTHYNEGDVLAVRLGNTVHDVVLGSAGFSQGEGMLALTAGSSGWAVAGEKKFFTEIFLRGGAACRHFGEFHAGDQVKILRETDLQKVISLLHGVDHVTAEKLDLHQITPSRVVSFLARVGLIVDGYDTRNLQRALADGEVIDTLLRGRA